MYFPVQLKNHLQESGPVGLQLISFIYKHSVPTPQETHFISISKISW